MKFRAPLALLTIAPSVAACQLLWSYDDYKDAPGSTTTSAANGGTAGTGGGAGGSSTSTTTDTTTTSSTSSTMATTTGSGCLSPDNPCDCDGDGDNAATPECDGGDCNDDDPLVNSKQTMWFYDAGSNGWDYDCNKNIEFEHTGPIQCPLLVPCAGPPQYIDAPPSCGEMGGYAECVPKGVGCVASNQQGLLTQGCH